MDYFDEQQKWWNSCTRKVKYNHKETAERAIQQMKIKKQVHNLEVYKCRNPECGGWHVGHPISTKWLMF